MPCASTHLMLADHVLASWSTHPDRSPLERPVNGSGTEIRRAFLHGSLAPDMGFVPGTRRFVSELAHYVTPTSLARALLREAGTPEERAFAWGWAAHVLGDVELHPLIGRAVGERIHGDRSIRMDAEADVETHVSIEVGLDMVLLEEGDVSPPPPGAFFRPGTVSLLGRALESTYGVPWENASLLRSHRRAVQLTRWWPRMLSVLAKGRWKTGLLSRGVGVPLEAARRVADEGSPARGFLGPNRPPRWMTTEVLERSDSFPARFQEWVDRALQGVPELNLETGEEAAAGCGHPATDRAVQRLERVRAENEETDRDPT